MPFIEIKLWKGRSDEQKKIMIRKVTDAVSESIDCPKAAVHIAITEYEKKNWGMGGKVSDEE